MPLDRGLKSESLNLIAPLSLNFLRGILDADLIDVDYWFEAEDCVSVARLLVPLKVHLNKEQAPKRNDRILSFGMKLWVFQNGAIIV